MLDLPGTSWLDLLWWHWLLPLPRVRLNLAGDELRVVLHALFLGLLLGLVLQFDLVRDLTDVDWVLCRWQVEVYGSLLERLVCTALTRCCDLRGWLKHCIGWAHHGGCLLVTVDLKLELLDELLVGHVWQDVTAAGVRVSYCHMWDHLRVCVLEYW